MRFHLQTERPLRVETERLGESVVIHITGQVNEFATDTLSAQLDSVLGEGNRFIVFDLANVTFLGSTGLGQIMRAYRVVKSKNGYVRIASAQPLIADVFRLTKLDTIVKLCPSVEEALTAEHLPPATP